MYLVGGGVLNHGSAEGSLCRVGSGKENPRSHLAWLFLFTLLTSLLGPFHSRLSLIMLTRLISAHHLTLPTIYFQIVNSSK